VTAEPDSPLEHPLAPERVPGRDVVAAFDFDGTLTRGGSVWKFLTTMVGYHTVLSAGIALLPKLVRAALAGGTAADTAKEALFVRTLAGRRVDDVAGRAVTFGLSHYRHRSRTKLRARLDWHRRQGHRVVLVSASPEYYVRAVGDELGVDGVVATRLEVDGQGVLTGRFEGGNCRGARKLAGLRRWMEEQQVEASSAPGPVGEGAHDAAGDTPGPYLWAYGNSAGDLEMLEAADVGVDAGRLGRFGKLRRFRRLGDVLTAW